MYYCTICGEEYLRPDPLFVHIQRVHKITTYGAKWLGSRKARCPWCDKQLMVTTYGVDAEKDHLKGCKKYHAQVALAKLAGKIDVK